MEQRKIVFAEHVKKQIINYHTAPASESKTDGAQVKLTPTQKTALIAICRENNVGVSTFISQALDAWIELFPFKDKISRHRDTLLYLLQSLS